MNRGQIPTLGPAGLPTAEHANRSKMYCYQCCECPLPFFKCVEVKILEGESFLGQGCLCIICPPVPYHVGKLGTVSWELQSAVIVEELRKANKSASQVRNESK